jgi:tRNA threonylcarbamoyl adenosine modification protein YeaZ
MDQVKRIGSLGQGEAPRDVGATSDLEGSLGPLILAVETSSRVGSVALALGAELLAERSFSAPLRHSMEILPSIMELLSRFDRRPQEIRQIHIDVGPGSFTGLRIAVAMAKAMNLAHGVRIVTVDTLDTIAANVADSRDRSMPTERLAVVLDAKRDQFFAAIYELTDAGGVPASESPTDGPGYQIPASDCGIWRKIVPDCLIDAKQLVQRFAAPAQPICVVGDGLLYHREAFAAEGVRLLDESLWSPAAAKVYTLGYQKAQAGRFAEPLTVVPFYLRGPDVTLKKV